MGFGAGVSSLTLGGVTSFTQKRNVYGPVGVPAVVSKTTSYVPAPGRTAPATGRGAPKESTYGLITSGRPGYPVRWFSSSAITTRGWGSGAFLALSATTPKFATGRVSVNPVDLLGPGRMPGRPLGVSG